MVHRNIARTRASISDRMPEIAGRATRYLVSMVNRERLVRLLRYDAG